MKLCKCGCGETVKPGNRFIWGHQNKGRIVTDETKKKKSKIMKGRKHSEETKEIMKGRKISEETRKKMVEGCKKRNQSEGFKNRRKSQKGCVGAHLDHKHTEETKRKISLSNQNPSTETRRKMSEARTGDKHPNWKGGISFEPYCHRFNNGFKKSIREKYGNRCFLCNKTEEENVNRKLSVHHITYNKNCGCDDNLRCEYVPLCIPCHVKTNYNRSYWENLILDVLKFAWK